MDWIPVSSSNLHSYYYESGTLFVRFKDKKTGAVKSTYQYDDVPLDVWLGLLGADSKGTYLDQHVKKAGYKYTPIG